jgi:CubicO group peptidase (beta-lactamase class C family)
MNTRKTSQWICLALILVSISLPAAAEEFTHALRAYLQQCVEAEGVGFGIVVGLVDEHGSRVVSYGKMDNGTDQEVDGDTVFEIGSITKTFTGLLLQDRVERGEMKMDDPVARYLPGSVKMPTRNGKEITLLQLATHTSGLPTTSVMWVPARAENPRADYTLQRMYDFLSDYRLPRDPGTKYEYSTVGSALLGHAIALKTGMDYESLVVDRICGPLKMECTRITLSPGLKDRFATGHSCFGYAVPSSYWGALVPGAAMRSTANDLLRYVSAHLGLMQSRLTPLMRRTQVAHAREDTADTDIGLAWDIRREWDGTRTISQGGLTDGFISFICFDAKRRRGVVVLANYQDFDVPLIGRLLLESEWRSDRRPSETNIGGQVYEPYIGEYQRLPHSAEAGIGIRREGDRLLAQVVASRSPSAEVLLPPCGGELLPRSEGRFFERLSCRPVTFFRDGRGRVTGLTLQYRGKRSSYEKTSDQPPKADQRSRPRIAISLATSLLDASTGHYEFAKCETFPAGMKMTLWREGDQLMGLTSGQNAVQGAFNVFAESETSFFLKVNGAQLTFTRDDQGQVTAVTYHGYRARLPDCEGRKVSEPVP